MTQQVPDICKNCAKDRALCVCDVCAPVQTKTRVLILQHPQEPDEKLGTGLLAHRMLPRSRMEVGLSWRNLSQALGEEADPKSWMVLYLGSADPAAFSTTLTAVDKGGKPLAESAAVLRGVKGIVVLDGTWSQAKTLWWRNAWLLKLRRGVLLPSKPSHYGDLRREPRAQSLSTIESLAIALSELEQRPEIVGALEAPFVELLKRYRIAYPGRSDQRARGRGSFRYRRGRSFRGRRGRA
ncbi:MAG: DTW domain-containing protein [Oligoflexia bacterium]|nr:DTW domain-containing protein [Oligoflexia bacterium]